MSGIVDIGCYWGHWPFFRTQKQSLNEISKLCDQPCAQKCLFSSIDAIFLRDPMYGDEELHQALHQTPFGQILTANPTMPAALDSLREGCLRFNACGVRLYPGYHGYKLTDKCVFEFTRLAEELDLPVIINLRVEDERLNYVVNPRLIPMREVEEFLWKTSGQTVVLSNVYINRMHELNDLRDVINELPLVYFDTCGLKDSAFIYDEVLNQFSPEKILYASQSPIYVRESSLFALQNEVSLPDREFILWQNAHRVFSL